MPEPIGARAAAARPRGAVDPEAIEVLAAPPLLTVQDDGRSLGRTMGLPRSGAMDLAALHATNVLAGNAGGAAALEWAGGGGRLRIRRPLVLALGGALAEARLSGRPAPWGTPLRARPGDVLEIAAPREGRWLYLAVAGGIAVPRVLGARATYLPAALGGLRGHTIARGEVLPVGLHAGAPPTDTELRPLRDAMRDVLARERVRVRPTLTTPEFPEGAWDSLLAEPWTVLPASDRMGTRLSPAEEVAGRLAPGEVLASRPSEPACIGLVQVPPDGQPVVLMPDGPTLGGYPAIACLRMDDLPALAQRTPGSRVRFIAG